MSGKNGGTGPSATRLANVGRKSGLELVQLLPVSATQLRRLLAPMPTAARTLFRESEPQSRLFNHLAKMFPPVQVGFDP